MQNTVYVTTVTAVSARVADGRAASCRGAQPQAAARGTRHGMAAILIRVLRPSAGCAVESKRLKPWRCGTWGVTHCLFPASPLASTYSDC